jgi:hypothetical protein
MDQAWAEYLAATQRLARVRREASAAAAERQAAIQAAQGELAHVRGRLALHLREWPRLGVPLSDLAPTAGSTPAAGAVPEAPATGTALATAPVAAGTTPTAGTTSAAAGTTSAAAGAPTIGGTPAEVLDALRRTRSMVDEADALVMGRPSGLAGLPAAVRNLFVYGPFAFMALAAQLLLLSLGGENPVYLPLCGLVLPAAAFGLGFVMVGLVFPAPPGGRVNRTPVLGAAVCLASVALLCAGMGILAALR